MTQTRSSRVAKAVRHVTAVRRMPAAAYGISKSQTAVVLGVVLPLLAAALFLLGAILIPAEALPWPRPARMLIELRDEIMFAGLGILAACATVSLLLLFAS